MSLNKDLISSLEESRNVMRGVLQLIDDDHDLYPDWKIKYVLAYVAGRDNAIITAIHAYPRASSATEQHVDDYISGAVDSLQEASYEEVMREWDAIREQLKSMVNDLKDSVLTTQMITPWGETVSIGDLVMDIIELEREQAEEILRGMKPR